MRKPSKCRACGELPKVVMKNYVANALTCKADCFTEPRAGYVYLFKDWEHRQEKLDKLLRSTYRAGWLAGRNYFKRSIEEPFKTAPISLQSMLMKFIWSEPEKRK